MWTPENRARYNRDHLRYPSDVTDEEWGLIEPLIPPAKRGGNRRHVNVREVVNGIMWFLDVSSGCEEVAEGGGDEVDDCREGCSVTIAAGARPGRLEAAVEAFEAGVAVV